MRDQTALNLFSLGFSESGQILFRQRLVIERCVSKSFEDGILFGGPKVLYKTQGGMDLRLWKVVD